MKYCFTIPPICAPTSHIGPIQLGIPTETNVTSPPALNANHNFGASFQDIPAAYVKEIQTGEFFELSYTILFKSYASIKT
jgi:hypothetical protein